VSNATAETAAARDKRMARLIAAELRAVFEEIFPEQPFEPPREWTDVILGQADAGASYTYTVSGAELWPRSVMCRLTCSAAVADRSLALEYQLPSGQRYCVSGSNVTAGAGDVHSWCWQPMASVGSWVVGDTVISPLPQQLLRSGHRLVIRLMNGDAGDQLDQIAVSARMSVPPDGDAPSID